MNTFSTTSLDWTPPPREPIQVSGGSSTDWVDKSAAIKSVMNWVKLHPTNVAQKAQIIIEHFRENVGWRLDGKVEGQLVAHRRLPRRRDDHGLRPTRLTYRTGPYPAERKPFRFRSGIWLPCDYGTTT